MKRVLNISLLLAVSCSLAWAQAPQRGAPAAPPPGGAAGGAQAPRGGGGGGRGGITGRILSFEANPASIKPGESFTLSWATEAGTASIDNGIGAIAPRGTIKLTPKATTTYTLSVGGVTRAITLTVAGTTANTPGAAETGSRPISRIDGKPDFSGVYGFTGMYGLGRGGGRGAAPAPASPFANLPAQPTLKAGVSNPRGGGGGTADCLPLPADTAFGVPYPFQIFQNKDYVILINEYPGTFRIVPIDQPHQTDADLTWMGDSVGRWDGDTLIIDTIAYNGRHSIGGIQQPSEKFHTIERLTRTSGTSVFYEIIYEDPEKATGQWRATQTFTQDTRPGVNKVMEFICENNRDYNLLYGPQGAPAAGGGGARGGGGGAGGGGRGGGARGGGPAGPGQ